LPKKGIEMKHTLLFMLFCVCFACSYCGAAEKITNSDISKGAEGWSTWARKGAPEFAVENTVGHNDSSSLRVTADQKGEDGSWKQSFKGSDFTKYHYDFWFKTKEPNKKVTFLAEFSNADLYLGQNRQDVTSNGTEWTHAEGDFSMTFGCDVQVSLWSNLDDLDQCTVWFDDIKMQDISEGSHIRYGITTPTNRVITHATKTVITDITTFGEVDSTEYDCELVLKSGNDIVASRKASVNKEGKVTLKLPKKLPLGKYYLSATIKDKSGKVLTNTTDVLIRRDTPLKMSFGKYDELLIDGKPFFPISVYWPVVSDLKVLATGGFNSAHIGWGNDPKPFMDEAEKLGMYCPMEIPEYSRGMCNRQQFIDKVDSLVKYPNLLAYYTSDEPGYSTCPPSMLEDAYNIVKERDQDRPVLYVDYMKLQYQLYRNAVDIIGTDPYESPASIGNTVQLARSAAKPGQPVWNVIGTFPAPDGTLPTPEYTRAAVYASLISGARGIFYFSAHFGNYDMTNSVLWDGIKALNSEIHTMTPYLLSAKPKMLLEKGPVSASIFSGKSGKLVLLLNNTDKEVSAAIPFGKGKVKGVFSSDSLISSGVVNLDLKPYETRAYLIGK